MFRVLVLGGDGMLGHKVYQVLSRKWPEDTYCTLRGNSTDQRHRAIEILQGPNVLCGVDGINMEATEALLEGITPAVTVNCMGIVKQREESNAYIPSITINSLLPHRLAHVCSRWGGRFIHISTDCVFSGKTGGYSELDFSDAEDLYGKTKYLGEVTSERALTLRTSIIGRELFNYRGLLEWLLSQNGRVVRGYTKALFSGVTTNHLATLIREIIEGHPGLSGLFQVTSGTISKHDLLCKLVEGYGLTVDVVPDESVVCDRSMKGDKFRHAVGYVCPRWTDLVSELVSDSTPYDKWRGNSESI